MSKMQKPILGQGKETKVCSKCGKEKQIKEFSSDRSKKDGKQCSCKKCQQEAGKQYYRKKKKIIKKQSREYYHQHREERKIYRQQYYQEHKKGIGEKAKQYYQEHKNEAKKEKKKYYKKNKQEIKDRRRKFYHNLAVIVFKAYGEKCVGCGEKFLGYLTIDHVFGAKDPIYNGYPRSGYPLYQKIIKNKFPQNIFRILCFNCNCRKKQTGTSPTAQHLKKIKREVVKKYGGKCINCGKNDIEILTIDHVYGKGNKEREKMGNGNQRNGARKLYVWLRNNPINKKYQVLCYNCNLGKSREWDAIIVKKQ